MELELTLEVVGIPYPNADGSSREAEARLCAAGEPVDLVPEPDNPEDQHAVKVVSARGVQLGYIASGRAVLVARRIAGGDEAIAIFHQLAEPEPGQPLRVAYVRARIGGGEPTLPAKAPQPAPRRSSVPARSADDFYPDPDGPTWGA
jgi:hypothetical protein